MPARILIVEDDPVSRDLLAALLACKGYIVDTADDGFGALRLAQEESFDVAFIDYHLPEMDGYALARLMRTLSEKTNAKLKMVAMTADQFGLAARRGVDSIFDRMLAKPIEPETLYALLQEFQASAADDFDAFLANDAQNAARVLWRARAISSLPKAAAFPAPSPTERLSLEYCFRLVEHDPDCLLLLRKDGLAEVERVRAQGAAFLQPLLVLDPAHADMADALFQVGNGDAWSAAATAITTFAANRARLDAGVAEAKDFETRLLAYLHVGGRTLLIRRDTSGRTDMPYTGGFAGPAVIEALKKLVAAGAISAKQNEKPTAAGIRELVVSLTAKGASRVSAAAANTATIRLASS